MTTLTISLPDSTARLVNNETKKMGFATRSEFIRALLRRYFAKDIQFEAFTPQPLAKIKLEMAKTGKYSEKFIKSVVDGLAKSSVYDN